jgi:hypothetical protein
MRNIEASEWLADPALEKVETKGASDSGAEFALFASQTGVAAPIATKAAPTRNKGAAQRGNTAEVGQ